MQPRINQELTNEDRGKIYFLSGNFGELSFFSEVTIATILLLSAVFINHHHYHRSDYLAGKISVFGHSNMLAQLTRFTV